MADLVQPVLEAHEHGERRGSPGHLRQVAPLVGAQRLDGLGRGRGTGVSVADGAVLAPSARVTPPSTRPSAAWPRSARRPCPTTGGFVVYGAGLITYGLARRQRRPGRAWAWAVATGVATLGVAAFPLGRPLSEAAHAVFAVAGYATLAALPIAASGALADVGHRRLSRLSVLAGTTTGALLLASALGAPAHGLTQRLGLTVGDAWVALSVAAMLRNDFP